MSEREGSPQEWFQVEEIGPRIWMIAEPWHAERVHSYLIEGARDVAILDTGMGVGDFTGVVDQLTDREPIVIQTHAHWDHIGASFAFERVLVHPAEAAPLRDGCDNGELRAWFTPDQVEVDRLPDGFDLETFNIPGKTPTGELQDGQEIDLGERTIRIYHTPGHSPGSVSVIDEDSGYLFPADALNFGPIYLLGPEAGLEEFQATLERLSELADGAQAIYPSHYDVPMQARDATSALRAYERVLAGEIEPHRENEIERYHVDRFEFLIDAKRLREKK